MYVSGEAEKGQILLRGSRRHLEGSEGAKDMLMNVCEGCKAMQGLEGKDVLDPECAGRQCRDVRSGVTWYE